ncbi:YceD family protein [Faecalitalea cylindroides]|uniref:YceD family protein n=1 Tax=Faecalitalea cylindroides TaxID=39483 RepID=UPI001898A65A|nr:YceD family protein [Faecalitalea cylindroides]MDB7946612.1 YceD family protein [Faecalitalea cylindroides]MDB7948475.1 YceD family protein [Faecalitalea cylindroides]MDB7950394.1 YceD family protein [Faecalitalea cylindroides]
MKFTKKDFLNAKNGIIEIDEWIAVEENDLLHHTQVKSIPEVHVTGTLQFDHRSLVFSDLNLDGVMIVLDSITMEDLEVAFDTKSQETYSFDPIKENDEDIIVVKKDTVDINPEIFQAIIYEAPMSITRLPRDQYPKGDGWQLLSDQDKEEPKIDPRWEKLNDFKLDDD